jgi:putative transposase
VADFLPEARYQLPTLHSAFYRTVFSDVPSTSVREVSRMLKAIHAQESRTNNPLERIMKEIRRRTRVVGASPTVRLNLAAARLRYIAGTTWSARP